MILVTLGTQDKPFRRLLEAVQKQIELGNITDKVIVQAGSTVFESNKMEIFDYIPADQFANMMEEADLIITHGGVGTIIDGVKHGKPVVVGARLERYGEHTNDHQLQILENFSEEGYIIPLYDFEKLDEALKQAKTFKPKEMISNTPNFINLLREEINKKTKKKKIESQEIKKAKK